MFKLCLSTNHDLNKPAIATHKSLSARTIALNWESPRIQILEASLLTPQIAGINPTLIRIGSLNLAIASVLTVSILRIS